MLVPLVRSVLKQNEIEYPVRISLIITNDYEVYGNGKGDVEDLVIEPTFYDISAAFETMVSQSNNIL